MEHGFPNPGQIKICGVTDPEQCREIASMGFGAIGFILYPPSPRNVEPEKAAEMAANLPVFTNSYAVVVNPTEEELLSYYDLHRFSKFQLHGDESPDFCQRLTRLKIPWIKAVRVKPDFSESVLNSYPCRTFLLDAYAKDKYGGTGIRLDWEAVKPIAERHRVILGGGINPANFIQAWNAARPSALDISTGLESAPGLKDMAKIKLLLENLEKARLKARDSFPL